MSVSGDTIQTPFLKSKAFGVALVLGGILFIGFGVALSFMPNSVPEPSKPIYVPYAVNTASSIPNTAGPVAPKLRDEPSVIKPVQPSKRVVSDPYANAPPESQTSYRQESLSGESRFADKNGYTLKPRKVNGRTKWLPTNERVFTPGVKPPREPK